MMANAKPWMIRTAMSAGKLIGTRYSNMEMALIEVPMARERLTPHESMRPPKNNRVRRAEITYAVIMRPPMLWVTPYVSIANSVIFTIVR